MPREENTMSEIKLNFDSLALHAGQVPDDLLPALYSGAEVFACVSAKT